MSEFLKMDVFFFVSTIGVIVFVLFGGFILWRVIRILGNVEHISLRASEESDLIKEDIDRLRSNIKDEGLKIKHVGDFLGSIFGRKKKHTKKE